VRGSTQQTSRRCPARGGRERSWLSAPALRTALREVWRALSRRRQRWDTGTTIRVYEQPQIAGRLHQAVEADGTECAKVREDARRCRCLRLQLHTADSQMAHPAAAMCEGCASSCAAAVSVRARQTPLRQGSRTSCQSMSTARHGPQTFVVNQLTAGAATRTLRDICTCCG
jgi:hypothetical protein